MNPVLIRRAREHFLSEYPTPFVKACGQHFFTANGVPEYERVCGAVEEVTGKYRGDYDIFLTDVMRGCSLETAMKVFDKALEGP